MLLLLVLTSPMAAWLVLLMLLALLVLALVNVRLAWLQVMQQQQQLAQVAMPLQQQLPVPSSAAVPAHWQWGLWCLPCC
jgi:hypothetical protein